MEKNIKLSEELKNIEDIEHPEIYAGKLKEFVPKILSEINKSDKERILRLAKFMHEEYENSARLFGWESQTKCRVPFKELPPANVKTMLSVAKKIIEEF